MIERITTIESEYSILNTKILEKVGWPRLRKSSVGQASVPGRDVQNLVQRSHPKVGGIE